MEFRVSGRLEVGLWQVVATVQGHYTRLVKSEKSYTLNPDINIWKPSSITPRLHLKPYGAHNFNITGLGFGVWGLGFGV